MIKVAQVLDHRYEHWILATMLLALAMSLLSDFGSAISASLITVHFGLFFLWQPIWQRDQSLDVTSSVLIIVFVGFFVAMLNWWLMFFWLILLIGIVAGRSFYTRQARIAYMIALTFLISALLIGCVPQIFQIGQINSAIEATFHGAWILLPLSVIFFPTSGSATRETFPVDFFRGVLIALITALLAVSAALITYQRDIEYPIALIGALLAVSLFLLMISWMFSPSSGGGLGALWEKSVLNIGTPFEAWLVNLASLSDAEQKPERFLNAAIGELTTMTWVSGAEWRVNGDRGSDGILSGYKTNLTANELNITLYTGRPVGPSLLIHCRLLIELLAQFHTAKLRELENAEQAHLRAVHETGARVTHDIKNLLQSLKATSSAIGVETDQTDNDQARNQERLSLLQRQMPHITQRLQLALDKLQQPTRQPSEKLLTSVWWEQFRQRHSGENLSLEPAIDNDVLIPVECFDSVVENLLDNARNKAKTAEMLEIGVRLESTSEQVVLSVFDNGQAIDENLAKQLFKRPVASNDGLGIGLYQAAQQAEYAGYIVVLATNQTGEVCFQLRGTSLRESSGNNHAVIQ